MIRESVHKADSMFSSYLLSLRASCLIFSMGQEQLLIQKLTCDLVL